LKVGCIVLAGGKSSRLGRDKASVELGGQTLLQRSVNNLEFLGSDIVVVAAPQQHLPEVNSSARLHIVRDITSGKGPLVGIYSGLLNLKYDYGFVVACDMPFIKPELIKTMIRLVPGCDVVMPRRAEGFEPLHSIYSRSCIGPIETLLGLNRYKIDNLLVRVKVRYLEEKEISQDDPEGMSFFNINTVADLVRARKVLEETK
jgi:molybdopterin-guanine dinucleotide biosynthesis protein A